jgi:hypothetical protein
MEIQTINLAAGAPQTFLIPGKFLEIIEAPYPLSIQFFDREGNAVADRGLVNAESGLFIDLRDEGGWGSILVESAQAQTIKVLIGSAMGGSRRQPGVVQVVDGGRARTMSGQSFMGNLFSAAGAGLLPHVQLWNPPASTKRLFVKKLVVSCSGSGGVQWDWNATALSGLDGLGRSKLADGAASVGERRNQAPAANILVNPAFMGSLGLAPNIPFILDLQEPIVLIPGRGLLIQSQTVASSLAATVDYTEDAI